MARARRRTTILVSVGAAFVVFCGVQDRERALGERRYVALQRDAIAAHGPLVRIDAVMAPAIARGVRQGLLWGALTLGLGCAVAVAPRLGGSRRRGGEDVVQRPE